MKVFVGYAGIYGSTRSIAEHLADRLAEHDFEVDCCPMNASPHTGDYDAFVLGSAVRDGNWLRQGTSFIRRHPSTLARREVWLFSTGLPPPLGHWPLGRAEPRQIPGFRMLIHPVEHRVFRGVLSAEHLSPARRMVFRTLGGHYGDHRDWKEIDRWAEDIAHRLNTHPARPWR